MAEYSREVLQERAFIVDQAEYGSLPRSSGVIVDNPVAFSHEQAVTRYLDGTAQLHIVDTTAFPPGGHTDSHGLIRRQTRYTTDGRASSRLFPDPIMYRRFNLGKPEGCPALSFTFAEGGDGWELAQIRQTYFRPTHLLDRESEPHGQRYTELETELTTALSSWMEAREAAYSVGFVREKKHPLRAHRPLRDWADFKNLQLIERVFLAHSPSALLDESSRATIESYLEDGAGIGSPREARAVLDDTTSPLVELLGILANSADIKKYQLSASRFGRLADGIAEGKIGLDRVFALAHVLGYATMAEGVITIGTYSYPSDELEAAMITLLQQADRPRAPKRRTSPRGLDEYRLQARFGRTLGIQNFKQLQKITRSGAKVIWSSRQKSS